MVVCKCGFCNVWLCVGVGFVMYRCVYVWVFNVWVCMCGFFMFGCGYVWVFKCVNMCMCGFCNVWVCVVLGYVICGCVYVCVL